MIGIPRLDSGFFQRVLSHGTDRLSKNGQRIAELYAPGVRLRPDGIAHAAQSFHEKYPDADIALMSNRRKALGQLDVDLNVLEEQIGQSWHKFNVANREYRALPPDALCRSSELLQKYHARIKMKESRIQLDILFTKRKTLLMQVAALEHSVGLVPELLLCTSNGAKKLAKTVDGVLRPLSSAMNSIMSSM